jgi:hypothetical protein
MAKAFREGSHEGRGMCGAGKGAEFARKNRSVCVNAGELGITKNKYRPSQNNIFLEKCCTFSGFFYVRHPARHINRMKRGSAAHESERKKLKKLLTVRPDSLGSHLRLSEKKDENGRCPTCGETAEDISRPRQKANWEAL